LLAEDNRVWTLTDAGRAEARRHAVEPLKAAGFWNRHSGLRGNALCDVRRNHLSRKYGFSKSTLRHACEGVGIHYEHLPELGIASEKRHEVQTQADYDALFAEYAPQSLPRQRAALEILDLVAAGKRVTCFERAPQRCHRHCVAESECAGRS
jgi:uncharacterized protein (DUF488 family)